MDMKDSCEICKFYLSNYERQEGGEKEDKNAGACRRYPPILLPLLSNEDHVEQFRVCGNQSDFFDQPYTVSWGWCGEFIVRSNAALTGAEGVRVEGTVIRGGIDEG